MGVALTPLLEPKPIRIEDLAGKTVVVDAYNMLYQFLTTIRMPDGTPLQDSQGHVTSHLVGLFSRVTNLMEKGVRLAFVFDGQKPTLKAREVDRRKRAKDEAAAKYAAAVEAQDIAAMRKFAGRHVVLTKDMVDEAKLLLTGLGIPIVQAPSEAEAQASRYVSEGFAYAAVSQDADCLLFGCPRYVKNLSIAGRRKRPGTPIYYTVEPELIELEPTLRRLGITHEQLVLLGILVGTDFNPGGVKGIGPKKALKLVREHKTPEAVFAAAGWDDLVPWQDVLELLTHLPTDPPRPLTWGAVDRGRVHAFLRNRGFSEDRLAVLDKLKERQRGLGEFW